MRNERVYNKIRKMPRSIPYMIAFFLVSISIILSYSTPMYRQVPQPMIGSFNQTSNNTTVLRSSQFTVGLSNNGNGAPGFGFYSSPDSRYNVITNLTVIGNSSVPIGISIYNESSGKSNTTYEGSQIYLVGSGSTQIFFYELMAWMVSGQFSVTDYELNQQLAAKVTFTNYQNITGFVFNISTPGLLESELSLYSTQNSGNSYIKLFLDPGDPEMLSVYGNLPPKNFSVAGKEVIFSDYSSMRMSISGIGWQNYSIPLSEISKVSLNTIGSLNASISGYSSNLTATASNGNSYRESGRGYKPYLISSETSIVFTPYSNSVNNLRYNFVANYSELSVGEKPQLESLINTAQYPWIYYSYLVLSGAIGWVINDLFGYIKNRTSGNKKI